MPFSPFKERGQKPFGVQAPSVLGAQVRLVSADADTNQWEAFDGEGMFDSPAGYALQTWMRPSQCSWPG